MKRAPRLVLLLISVALASSCGSPGGHGSESNSASRPSVQSTSPPSSTQVASTPRVSASSTPPSRSAFPDCRLPYVKPAGIGFGPPPFIGGFVSGEQASWSADAAGALTQSGQLLVTEMKPVLTGSGFSSEDTGSYDAAAKRWLPVGRSQVRSDGLAYAYPELFANTPGGYNDSTRIHVISLVDGTDRVIYSGPSSFVLAYEPTGIYVNRFNYGRDGLGTGLERLDPTTGSITEIPNGAPFEAIAGRSAFSDGGSLMPRTLVRMDVVTGVEETWFRTDEPAWLGLVGIDGAGHPIIDVNQGANFQDWQLEVLTAPMTATPIAGVHVRSVGVTDNYGTWLAGSDGIYLLRPDSTIVRVSDVTGGNVAGGCG